jgi:LacI family transcriptional regulator
VEASARAGYLVMLSMINPDMGRGLPERILHSQQFDGVIMLFSDVDNPIFPFLKDGTTPLVLCGSHPSFGDWTSVDAQHREGAQCAVEHLVRLGHRRIATITGPLRDVAAHERRDGYLQGLLDAQLPVAAEFIVEGDWTHERGYTAMQELLRVATRPSAVFVASDTMALGAIRAINEAGLRVPDDVALVSFDDLPLASYANPPLTTIRQPITGSGATAVKLLIDQIEQRNTPVTHVRLPTELVVRRSCGAASHNRHQ